MDKKLLYHHEKPSKEFEKAIEWTTPNGSIMEMGCHTGVLSSEFKAKRNCKVTGVEINSDALEVAKPFLENAFCLDLNNENSWKLIPDIGFDVVTWIHVLEHLIDPELSLQRSMKFLKKD